MDFVLEIEARKASGSSGSRRLRRTGKIPAVVYGGGKSPESIALDHDRLVHEMEHESFFTSILTLKGSGGPEPVVAKDVQRHPYKPVILHMDFQRIVADQAITLDVPIHFLGEEEAIGVKEQGGVVEHILTSAEVSCLPRDLPEYLELDVTALELNELLHLSDIKLPEGVTLVALEHDLDQAVVAINPPRREEEEEPVEAEAMPEEEAAAAEAPEDEEAGEKGKDKGEGD